MELNALRLIPIIMPMALYHNLPVNLILAIIEVESGFDSGAIRTEKNYKYVLVGEKIEELARTNHITVETELQHQKNSYGYMQLMGANFRDLGFKASWNMVFDPIVNIGYGIKFLSRLKKRWPEMSDYVAAYNAGAPRKNDDGSYINQNYVDDVFSAMRRLD